MPNRIAGLSIPKSGTHLLAGIFKRLGFVSIPDPRGGGRQILEGIDLPDGKDIYVYGHWRYSSKSDQILSQFDFKKILLIRDPRDMCLSMADYIKAGRLLAAGAANSELVDLPIRTLQIM